MLEQVKTEHCKDNGKPYHFGYLYLSYRITSFYAHGNISKTILDKISTENNNFTIVNIPEIIGFIANRYNVKICKLWPNIKDKLELSLV